MADDYDAEIEREIAEIREQNIGTGSRKSYGKSAARFILFLFAGSINMISPIFHSAPPPLCYPTEENVGRFFKLPYEERIEIMAPIRLDTLTAKDFMRFLVTLRKKDGEKPSASTLSGHQSALFHLYREFQTDMPPRLVAELKRHFRGLKRIKVKDLGEGIGKLKVGKDPLDIETYRLLSLEMYKLGDQDAIFTHCVATSSWNLGCRVGNAVGLCWSHAEWKGDALTWMFAHTKTDQQGDTPRLARHVYANSTMPEICPILSLAVFLMCFEPD